VAAVAKAQRVNTVTIARVFIAFLPFVWRESIRAAERTPSPAHSWYDSPPATLADDVDAIRARCRA
jgi:hypothetical protein